MELPGQFFRSDLDAFESIFREHQNELYGRIVRIVRDPAAEDHAIGTRWRIYPGTESDREVHSGISGIMVAEKAATQTTAFLLVLISSIKLNLNALGIQTSTTTVSHPWLA